MKKFFQNIKFKKISLTTLALALVVSGFLVWGNKIEAATTAVSIDSPTSASKNYVQSGGTVEVQFDVTTNAEGFGTIIVEISNGSNLYQAADYNYSFTNGENLDITKEVLIGGIAPEGSYSVKVTAQQPGGSNTQIDTELDAVVVDNTLPVVETISVNDEAVAEGDVGVDAFVVTVDFSDTNPMDETTNPTVTFDPALGTTMTSCSNSWTDSDTFTYTCNIADGNIETADIDVVVSGAKDKAGNTMSGTFTESDEFDVDTVAPTVTATIEPNKGTAKVGDTITATLTEGGSQADLNLSGTCTINGVDVTGSFVNNTGGTYTLSYVIKEADTDHATGNLPVSCTLAETSGNTVTLSSFEVNTLEVDANSPAAPAITSIAGDHKINDSEKAAVIIVGTAEANATISGSLTGTGEPVAVSGSADGSGNFSITVDASGLADGTLSLSITATDAAGNESDAGTSSAVKDIEAPAAPAITSIAGDDKVNDSEKAAVIIVGTAEANATINGLLTGAGTDVTVSGAADGSGNFSITVDASGLADGTLSLSITATDAAGNVSTAGTSTAVKDIAAPVISSVTSDATGTGVLKVGETITFTVTMSATEDGLVIAPTAYNGGTLEWSTANSGATYTATYTIAEGQNDQGTALQLTGVTATDTFGNTSAAVSGSDVTDTIDANKPTGYSVTFDQTYVNNTNKAGISFTFAGAEGGATYNYSIDDDNAGTAAVTGTSTISTATDQITSINVSSLSDGTLTITVTLTDPAGNIGDGVTDTIVKDIAAPTGYSVTFDQTYVNNTNKAGISFTFAGAEGGATYNYSIDDDNAGTAAVTGTSTISTATDQITSINVSSLNDGTLTMTVTLTDPAGNAGTGVTDTIVKETVAPVINSVTSNATGAGVLKVGGTILFTVTMSAAEDGLVIAPTAYNGGTLVWSAVDSGATYTATYTIAEGQTDQSPALQLTGVTATDTFGNTSSPATDGADIVKTIDANSPTVTSVTFNDTALKIGDTATVTIVMSEAVTGFDKTDVTTPNGTLGDLTTGDDITFTGTFAPNASTEAPTNVATVGTGFTDIALNPALTSAGATSANYAIDTLAPALPVDGIVGTTSQGAGDQIILTFSEAVSPSDGTWSDNEFESIESPDNTAKTLTGATFSPETGATTTLTITLAEDSTNLETYLRNGNIITVKPASNKIKDASGNFVANSEVVGTTAITGDVVAPTVALTYSPDRSLLGLESVMITATFNELMDGTTAPRIAIDTQGDGDLVASTSTAMTKTAPMVWTFDWQVPGGHDDVGIATVSVTGTDLAGNANATASNNTRVITSPDSIITGFTAGSITTTGATLTVTTSENATCKYATEAATFANMIEMGGTGGTTHTQALTGLTEGTKYTNYRVRCSISSNAVSDLEYVEFTTNSVAGNGSFGIISKTMTKMTGAADNTYANGWEWTIRMTLPSGQNSFALKFNDWVSGSNTMAAGGNMEYYSEQISSGTGSSASPIAITDDNTYPDRVTVLTDVDPNLDGIQTDIHIKVKIPSATPAGSYGTGFQVLYE